MTAIGSPGNSNNVTSAETGDRLQAPTLSLPKGGGSIRGIGEKFGVDAVTGTGSISVPIAFSPGRAGFGPDLALHYDSGAGNGPFGLGWGLKQPSITRKTDKGLPLYRDSEESDVFILAGAEDLVPLPAGKDDNADFTVRRYRPRIDALYSRIERWTNRNTGEIHWRSLSRDNITTVHGATPAARIADPDDANRIFEWLIEQRFDDKGNAISWQYVPEDSVNLDLSLLNEKNRSASNRSASRYLKRIRYGNRTPNRDPKSWVAFDPATLADTDWMFEVVFDYGEGHFTADAPDANGQVFVTASVDPAPGAGGWMPRPDPFSSYRAGFEQRMYRLCARVLMFHRFPDELGIDACLVRSTALTYSNNPVATYLSSVTQSGFVRQPNTTTPNRFLMRSMPPLDFEFSMVPAAATLAAQPVRDLPVKSLENLPEGVDGRLYQWIDFFGEGMPGIFSEHSTDWYFKHNRSANHRVTDSNGLSHIGARFGPLEAIGLKPAASTHGDMRLEDLDGDGQLDLVRLEGAARGYHQRAEDGRWTAFRAFASCPAVSLEDPELKLVDLTGDGHADILVTEGDRLRWYPSLVEKGFGPSFDFDLPADEEKGPRLVFADSEGAIYLADMTGDGLSDMVRVRNGNVSYWPNLGYGTFGAKVAMDDAPWFDFPDRYDQSRIRLADIDGSGTTDVVYLHPDGPRLYANQSGNSFGAAVTLTQFPCTAELETVEVLDLLGTGTASLVWSSPLLPTARRSIRYITLMEQKPHLLVAVRNNFGAETRVSYAPSTKFYLDDLEAGIPWLTRLPFPVHVVERVQRVDLIAGNVFTTRNTYHHGFFDGVEREFRGFAMVEQQDEEAIGLLSGSPQVTVRNQDPASNVPPVLTRSWYYTGVYMGADQLLETFAGLRGGSNAQNYFREPGLSDADFRALLLPETALPAGPTPDDVREAYRALKGSLLRQEVYGLDRSARASIPYTVEEHNFTVTLVQAIGSNRHAIFRVDPAESVSYNYERQASDPRVEHSLALEVDAFGDVLQSASIAYGRRQPDPTLNAADQAVQAQTLVTYAVAGVTDFIDQTDDYRSPLPASSITYELTGYTPSGPAGRFQAADLIAGGAMLFDTEIAYESSPTAGRQRRPFKKLRTLYRSDDLSASLGPGVIQSLAIPLESYQMALTPGLVASLFVRNGVNLLPDPAAVLDAPGGSTGGFVDLDNDGSHWVPSGRSYFSPGSADDALAELAYARAHFFLACRYRTPFHTATVSTESLVTWDAHYLLVVETRDPLGNRVTAGQRLADDSIDPAILGNDYRVLQLCLLSDPNRNRQALAFDALGLLTATAVMGKPEEALGDNLDGLVPDLPDAVVQGQIANPTAAPQKLIGNASTRFLYDLDAYQQSGQAPVTHLLARQTHFSDPDGTASVLQMGFTYSDGFGREIQTKRLAPDGQAPQRDANGAIVIGPDGQPVLTAGSIHPRWLCSGWTVFNNKGKPVRQYEPFFTDTQAFELGVVVGVSPILFYDPLDRVVATLHPDHSYDKVAFDAWTKVTWDANDTVLSDPRTDADIAGITQGYFASLPANPAWQTWYQQRQSAGVDPAEQDAAAKAAAHAGTPTTDSFDSLGRPFVTFADNGPDTANPGRHLLFATHTALDIEGNQRAVRDALDRTVMLWDYDMLKHRLRQQSMEAGARWTLFDAAGKTIQAWDSRAHFTQTDFDPLRRPLHIFVTGADPSNPADTVLTERFVYGEQNAGGEGLNLLGKLWFHYDQAGLAAVQTIDFEGNTTGASRRVALDYKNVIPWGAVDAVLPVVATIAVDPATLEAAQLPLMDADAYLATTTYDALHRPLLMTSPHTPAMQANQTRNGYDLLSQLQTVDVNLRGAAVAGQLVWTPFVTAIDHDAKGQRQRITYGNGTITAYSYDRETYRLKTLLTSRNAATFPGDAPTPPPVQWPGSQAQNLAYSYDPVGNITRITDSAQQTIYFRNQRVDPSNSYTYDPLYRLIAATGREHLGQAGGVPTPYSWNDAPRVGIPWSQNDGKAMGTYVESSVYDAVGNFQQMAHIGSNPANAGWTQIYSYQEPSQIEPAKFSNRLSATSLDGGHTWQRYSTGGDGYDAHGNMLQIAHLPTIAWDYRDCMSSVDLIGGGDAWYVYDSGGQRLRKVWEKSAALIEERIYLAGFEIFRRHPGSIGVGTATLERETLHVMDDKQRIALVEARTLDTQKVDKAPAQLIRYQFGNHLGSAVLELDDQSQIISYEEYSPYGSTTYQAVASLVDTPKRYRFTGKERDEETGFAYHGARYYASWLGIWNSTDPKQLSDGTNLYSFCRNNPVIYVDQTGKVGEDFRAAGNVPISDVIRDILVSGNRIVQGAIPQVESAVSEIGELLYEAPPEGKVAAAGVITAASPEIIAGLIAVGLVGAAAVIGNHELPRNSSSRDRFNPSLENFSFPGHGNAVPITVPSGINSSPEIHVPGTSSEQLQLPATSGREVSLPPREHSEGVSVSPKGGVYVGYDPTTGRILPGTGKKTGRSNDVDRRIGEHARNPDYSEYEFVIFFLTDVYAQQRGLEKFLYEVFGHPEADKIGPISSSNKKGPHFIRSADRVLKKHGLEFPKPRPSKSRAK
jgi:RHS repeat-associated protein